MNDLIISQFLFYLFYFIVFDYLILFVHWIAYIEIRVTVLEQIDWICENQTRKTENI